MIHDKHCEEAMRVLNARVSHFNEDIGILLEINHEFLLLLHVSELVFINAVCVMEEQVILTGQFDLDLMNLIRVRAVQK